MTYEMIVDGMIIAVPDSVLIESGKIRRTAEGTEITDVYAVWTTDPVVAFFSAPAHGTPHPILDLCLLQHVEVEPQATSPIYCKVTLTYAEPVIGEDDLTIEEWNFDLSSQSTKITSVPDPTYIQHIPPTEDIGLAIGFDGVEKVDGADVFRGQTTARCVRLWEFLDPTGFWAIEAMRNTINSAAVFGFSAGTVLFLGANISQQPDGLIAIEYNFALKNHLPLTELELADGTTITIGGPDSGAEYIVNSPFDHIWYVYEDAEAVDGEGAAMPQRKIKSIHVAQVYDTSDLNDLCLVGPW